MRDDQVRIGNSIAEMQVFGIVAILRELLQTSKTGWMSRNSRGNHVVDELYIYAHGRYAR